MSRKLKDLYIKNPQNKLLLIALQLVLNEYYRLMVVTIFRMMYKLQQKLTAFSVSIIP